MDSTNGTEAQLQQQQVTQGTQDEAQTYRFPTDKLRVQHDVEKTPLVLVVCGSFSPITIMHLRMCEMASDWVRIVEDSNEVVGIYLSPVSDAYKKVGLAEATHRIQMCELAAEASSIVMVDPWEATQPQYIPTAQVLEHFKYEINEVLGGIQDVQGVRRNARVALLAGSDLLQTMSQPGVWSTDDLEKILGDGIYVVDRIGTDTADAKAALGHWGDNVTAIPQGVPIDLSSTKVRLYLKKGMSVKYFVPDPVIDYIMENGLYPRQAIEKTENKGKEKEPAGLRLFTGL